MANTGCPDSFLESHSWFAIDNQMPPDRSFYVNGKVVVSSAGYAVALSKAASQGGDPTTLLLDLVVKKPTGPAARVVTTHDARYQEDPYAGSYSSVLVRCGRLVVAHVNVEVVH